MIHPHQQGQGQGQAGQFSSIYQFLQAQFGIGQQQQGPFPGFFPLQGQAQGGGQRQFGGPQQFGAQRFEFQPLGQQPKFQASPVQSQQPSAASQSVWNPFQTRMKGRK